MESSTGSGSQPRLQLDRLAEEALAERSPGGLLADALEAAFGDVSEALAPNVALESISRIDRKRSRTVLKSICLLEAADRAEASVHGLARGLRSGPTTNGNAPSSPRFTPSGATPEGHTAMGLAGAWLRARATELVAELGASALHEQARALTLMAAGWRREAQDLYDAARTPRRCLETAQQRSGSLNALAACLNAIVEENRDVESLRRFGAGLGTAALIRDDIQRLSEPANESHPLRRGAYSLPVACALEANPKLASRLGGAVAEDVVAEIVAEIRAAGGFERAREESEQHIADAIEAIKGIEGTDGLVAVAEGVATHVSEAAA